MLEGEGIPLFHFKICLKLSRTCSVGSESCVEQLQNCAPHLLQHYYHNLWWETNRSSIRSVGKLTTTKDLGLLFQQQAHKGQLACSVRLCVLSLITAWLKRVRGITAFILPLSSSPPSRPVAFAPYPTTAQRPRSIRLPFSNTHYHHLISQQPSPGVTLHPHLHPTTPIPSPDIPPAASPLFTCCPGDSIAPETTSLLCTMVEYVCVLVWQRSEQKLK